MKEMDQLRYSYLLPIGSIVKVKGMEQRMMIYGILQKGKATGTRVFDYIGVPYPEGVHDSRLSVGFDHGDVKEVVFRGYEDKDREAFLLILEAMARKAEKSNANKDIS